MRPLLEEAYEKLREGWTPIVVAPTGYGKTRASPEILDKACADNLSCGLIHVAPLRSLVYSIYKNIFEDYGGAYQMHDPIPAGDKSPYYLRDLVVTTIDSYIWNLYRIPVTEFSVIEKRLTGGHYYPIYTSIFTSINVFDEAHLYLGSGDPNLNYGAVKASVSTLVSVGTPAIIETATLPTSKLTEIYGLVREAGGKPVVITLSCRGSPLPIPTVSNIVEVKDDSWIDNYRFSWTTLLYNKWDSVIEEMIADSFKGVVLAVTNTVANAVKLYNEIKHKHVLDNVYLIHGRLSEEERRGVEEAISSIDEGIVIGTQVIEAGVDVNALAVYTELAPIENLVQRVGRSCRRGPVLNECKERGGKVVVIVDNSSVGIYSENVVEASLRVLKEALTKSSTSIDWRTPCRSEGVTPYTVLLETSINKVNLTSPLQDNLAVSEILQKYLQKDMGPFGLLDLLEESKGLCSLFRNTIMAQVLTSGGIVTTSLEWVLSNAEEILERGKTGAPLIALLAFEGSNGRVIAEGEAVNLWKVWSSRKYGWYNCKRLSRALQEDIRSIIYNNINNIRFIWLFKAKDPAYVPRQGLITSKERKMVKSHE